MSGRHHVVDSPSMPTVVAATQRKFRVLWYDTTRARSAINPGQPPRPLPRSKPQRVETFFVEARKLDVARSKARDYVRARLGPRRMLLSVNFTQRPDELVVYTAEKRENSHV